MIFRRLAAFVLLGAVTSHSAFAQEALFLIRHAEKAEGDNPPITEEGRARAVRWADMLAGAGIDKIFTSTARRTMETGAIIAKALDVETEALSPGDTTALLDMIGFDHEDGRVLIVGHNETIPAILAELGMSEPVQMSDPTFSRLFVVVPGTDGLTVIDMSMP